MNFYVKGTYREDGCNRGSAIAGLVLTEKYSGFNVHDLKTLKPLADAGRLCVYSGAPCGSVPVRIFWSTTYSQYVATTRADGLQCNNLLSLTVYFPASKEGTTTSFAVCAV